MKKFHVKGGLAGLPPDNHMLHIVVEHFLGAAAQVVKGVDVAVHKGLERALFHELHIEGPGEPEDHDEGIDGRDGSIGVHDLKVSPVNLRLEGRFGLEPEIGDPLFLALEIMDQLLHPAVAAGIAHPGKPVENPGGLVVILVKIVLDDLHVGIEDALSPRGPVILRKRVALDMTLHRQPVQTSHSRNPSDTQSVPMHDSDVHKHLPGNHR